MSTAMMSAPSWASRTAWLRPCPRAAPVMKATLPSTLPAICGLLFCVALLAQMNEDRCSRSDLWGCLFKSVAGHDFERRITEDQGEADGGFPALEHHRGWGKGSTVPMTESPHRDAASNARVALVPPAEVRHVLVRFPL